MKSPVVCALIAGICSANVLAQEECGTQLLPGDAQTVRELINAGAFDVPDLRPRGTLVVPLTFHVVRRSDGTGGLPPDRIAAAFENSNIGFAGTGIQFCMPGEIDFIDDDHFFFEVNTIAEIDELRAYNRVPGTLNVYFTENLSYEGGGLCGISSFTFSPVQGIVMANGCTATATNTSTLPHEYGHYFNLFHTHEGFFGRECADGSNCDIAGDLLCDTPADPGLSRRVNPSCEYFGGAIIDSCNGDLFSPDPSLFMSYARAACRTTFSPQQTERMIATILNLRPDLIHTTCPTDPCWADWNDDDIVNTSDFGAFLDDYNFARTGNAVVYRSPDLQGPAGIVNTADFLMFLNGYLDGCL